MIALRSGSTRSVKSLPNASTEYTTSPTSNWIREPVYPALTCPLSWAFSWAARGSEARSTQGSAASSSTLSSIVTRDSYPTLRARTYIPTMLCLNKPSTECVTGCALSPGKTSPEEWRSGHAMLVFRRIYQGFANNSSCRRTGLHIKILYLARITGLDSIPVDSCPPVVAGPWRVVQESLKWASLRLPKCMHECRSLIGCVWCG